MSWVKLKIRCPRCGNGPIKTWEHTGCGSDLYINKYAKIECGKDHKCGAFTGYYYQHT